jgi:hypothetical protein
MEAGLDAPLMYDNLSHGAGRPKPKVAGALGARARAAIKTIAMQCWHWSAMLDTCDARALMLIGLAMIAAPFSRQRVDRTEVAGIAGALPACAWRSCQIGHGHRRDSSCD